MQGTVLRAQSGFFWVQTDAGVLECRLRGRLKKERQAADIAVIGDEVEVTRVSPREGAIEAVAERRTRFSRRQPGSRGVWKEDVMVANLDQVLIVFACARPQPHARMIDRFLVIAESNEVAPVIVANKIDLVGEEEARRTFAVYERVGYPVHYVSARAGMGLDALRQSLAGRISVFTGPSGVGKSSLLNAIQPGMNIATGPVSELLNKGRHTTTVAQLHELALPGGGFVADTPGIRELGLWQIPPTELAWCFPEFRDHLGGCAFNDCSHLHEPRCGLRAAVEAGAVHEARYDSYRRMLTGDLAA
jgi:ribosome biogenesis GTPase